MGALNQEIPPLVASQKTTALRSGDFGSPVLGCSHPFEGGGFLAAVERAKLDAMKELAYGASHEINNPLANISARAQTLLRDEADPERSRALEAIHLQALRAHEMISDLMLFARPPKLTLAPVELGSVMQEVLHEVGGDCDGRRIKITLNASSEGIGITADATQLAVAILALIRNSIEAIGVDGAIEITYGQAVGDTSRPRVAITVRDDGPGISEAVRPHIFDPFFSGREAGRGLGFGLSKAWRIITEHGGGIECESCERGAAFRIELPPAAST